MARKIISRDTWLFENAKKAGALRESVAKVAGRLEPASDHTFKMLEGPGPMKLTEWGGSDPDSGVVIMKAAPEYPESRQLRDPFTTFYTQGIALEPPLPPDRMLNLTEENPIHSGCLMAKAYDACGRGWDFKPKKGKEADKTLLDSDLPLKLSDAMESLTPDLTFTELLYQAAWEMDAIGWSAWEVVRDLSDGAQPGEYGDIGAIYPIPSHTLRASLDPRKWVQLRAGRVRYFKKFGAKCEIHNETGTIYDWKSVADKKKIKELDPAYVASELIIFKSYTPRSLWYGVPKWVASIATIAELSAIREFNISWFASGGQTDYNIHFAAEDIETAKKMVGDAQQQMRENAGRGHTFLLTAGSAETKVTVAKLGELLREGHFRFRRGDLAKEVLIAHNVPGYRIGWAETGALAGSPAQQMLDAYKTGAIEPIQLIIEDRLRQTLFDPDMGINTGEFRLKLADLDTADVKDELDEASKAVDEGMMTPAQARDHLGWEAESETHPQYKELHQYFYKGTPLGETPTKPGQGGGNNPFKPQGNPMQPGGNPNAAQPGARPDGQPDSQADPAAAQRQALEGLPGNDQRAVQNAIDAAVYRHMEALEAKFKDALTGVDPIDPPDGRGGRPKGRKGRRGTGGPAIIADQPADQKPHIV